jgi:quercetin dioxygenase-like cupin family protein
MDERIRSSLPLAKAAQESEALWFFGQLATILVAGEDSGEQFALVEITGPRGACPPWHVQPDDDETFYVLEGDMTFWAGDQEQPVRRAGAGDVVSIPRGTPHSFHIDSETARYLTFHTPAGHERFYRDAAEPARERVLPPPTAPDIARVQAAGRRHGVEFLGPPPVD